MVYIYCINLVCAFFAPVSSRFTLLMNGPAPDRVRLHGIDDRPDLEGVHATKLTGVGTRVVGGWIAVQLPEELIFIHEETESSPVATGLLAQAIYSAGAIEVVEQPGRGYGMIASRRIAQGEVVLEEDAIVVVTIDDSDEDPEVTSINDDARTVLALAQIQQGAPPAPNTWANLPGMKAIADRITMLQSRRAFDSLPPHKQKAWMSLCDSSRDSLVHVDGSKVASAMREDAKSAAGVLHSNGFGGTAGGARTVAMFETLSRCNHSCAPNVDLQTTTRSPVQSTDGDGGASADGLPPSRTARLIALRDVDAGEELTLSYLGSVGSARMEKGAEERRAELRRKYRFHCECVRCGVVSAAAKRRYERQEAWVQQEDERVCEEVAAFNQGKRPRSNGYWD